AVSPGGSLDPRPPGGRRLAPATAQGASATQPISSGERRNAVRTGKCPGCKRKGVLLREKTIPESSEGNRILTLELCALCFGRHERGALLLDMQPGRRPRSASSPT